MSFYMITIEGNNRIIAMADKRIGKGITKDGELVSWEHLNDDRLKIQPITKTLYYTGGTISDMSDELYDKILEVKGRKPSEIVEIAIQHDKEIKPPFFKTKFNQAIIFGIYDDGRLFIWASENDGTRKLHISNGETTVDYAGGLGETKAKVIAEVKSQYYRNGKNLKKAMMAGMSFAATIDKVISPTYDVVILNRTEFNDGARVLLTNSGTGERWIIEGENNRQTFYNSNNEAVIMLDDSSAIEGTFYTDQPPLFIVNPDGSYLYPKNYLGSQNMGNGTFRYYYTQMGPGISTGVSPTHAEGFSTMGRKEIFTNGKFRVANADESQKTEMTKLGITTTGNAKIGQGLEVSGGIKLNDIPGPAGDRTLRIDANGQIYRGN